MSALKRESTLIFIHGQATCSVIHKCHFFFCRFLVDALPAAAAAGSSDVPAVGVALTADRPGFGSVGSGQVISAEFTNLVVKIPLSLEAEAWGWTWCWQLSWRVNPSP